MRHGFGRAVAMCGLIIGLGTTIGCIEGGVPSDVCDKDSDCAGGQVCRNNACVRVQPPTPVADGGTATDGAVQQTDGSQQANSGHVRFTVRQGLAVSTMALYEFEQGLAVSNCRLSNGNMVIDCDVNYPTPTNATTPGFNVEIVGGNGQKFWAIGSIGGCGNQDGCAMEVSGTFQHWDNAGKAYGSDAMANTRTGWNFAPDGFRLPDRRVRDL